MDIAKEVIEIADAIESEDVDGLSALLDRYPEQIHRNTANGTWLHLAAHQKGPNKLKVATLLLQKAVDVNAKADNSTHDPPLFSAIVSDQPDMVQFLLQQGGNPNFHKSVISAIVGDGKHALEIVKLLDQFGADLHQAFTNEYTNQPMNALSAAIEWGKHDVVDYLRSKGAVLPVSNAGAMPMALRGHG